jgi:endonuclease VIII
MPEGPEIRQAAAAVNAAIGGRKTTEVHFGLEHLKPFEPELSNQFVVSVTSHGKAMLTRFDNGLSIYSHNQLYGRWCICNPGEAPDTRRQLRLAIHNQKQSALLYSASEIEVLDDHGVSEHPFLSRLGPDVLDQDTDTRTVMQRLRDRQFSNRRLGNLLTEQSFLAGLGNYLRCEILFVAGLHPSVRPCDCDSLQLSLLASTILGLARQSYATAGITNELQRAEKLKNAGMGFEQYRFHVFRRAGQPCYRCEQPIQRVAGGSQACYLCPGCQGKA